MPTRLKGYVSGSRQRSAVSRQPSVKASYRPAGTGPSRVAGSCTVTSRFRSCERYGDIKPGGLVRGGNPLIAKCAPRQLLVRYYTISTCTPYPPELLESWG